LFPTIQQHPQTGQTGRTAPAAPRSPCPKGTYKLPGRFYGIKKPLHPGLFAGGGIFLDDSLPRRSINFFDHVFQGGLRFTDILFLSKYHKFLRAAPYRRLYRFVSDPAIFTLPVPLLRGTEFIAKRYPPI
jgi:hypothetical protein